MATPIASANTVAQPIRVRTAGGREAVVLERKQRGWFAVELDGNANNEGGANERKTLRRPQFAPGQDHLLNAAPQAAPKPKADAPPPPGEPSAIENARARAASGAPAPPSARTLAQQSRAAAWTRRQEDDLLVAFEDGKTEQALADAVGGGRSVQECERKLERLTPSVKQLAYDWDPKKPRKHTAKIRASLPAAEQNLSKAALTKLWKPESAEFRQDAIERVVNVGLGSAWNNPKTMLDILVEMGLPPGAFRMTPKPPKRLTKPFKKHSEIIRSVIQGVRLNRAAREAMLAGEPLQSPYALLNDDGSRLDQACYGEMRTKGCLLVAISLGANEETEMPTIDDLTEIVGWTVRPSFERLNLPRAKTSFAHAAYARQFCYICCSLFVLKGGRVFVEHCKERKERRGVHGFCRSCNVGVLCLADVIRSAVAKAGLSRSVALKAVDIIADASEVEDADFDDMFDCD